MTVGSMGSAVRHLFECKNFLAITVLAIAMKVSGLRLLRVNSISGTFELALGVLPTFM